MKFLHISDLHLGKRVNEFSMIEDQKFILKQILASAKEREVDGVLIAGDVYDKSVPPTEAVQLFDEFLVSLAALKIPAYIISGNHDSAERISFGARLMSGSGVYFSPVYDGQVKPITLSDAYGEVNIYLLPFVKPAHVRRYFEGEEIVSYTDAMRTAIGQMQIQQQARNILITHQFVVGSERSESEETSVGGTDGVDAGVFEGFDYVALGHLHRPQNCSATIRYCGTPLKYSFSEVKDEKSLTLVELKEKGQVRVELLPLTPLRGMAEIKGSYAELTARSYYDGKTLTQDYLRITLTDEDDIPDAAAKLRIIYKGLMELRYDNARTRKNAEISGVKDLEKKTPLELFAEFFELQNNAPMSEEQSALVQEIVESIWEEEV